MRGAWSLSRIAGIILLAIPLRAFALDVVNWTEDALLHDGRIIKVALRATNTIDVVSPWPLVLRFESSGFDRFGIAFRHPDTQVQITWQGERRFSPLLVDVLGGIPYLVVFGRPDKSTASIYGCPELPYIYLKFVSNNWIPIPVEDAPHMLAKANLHTNPIGIETDGRHFTTDDIARETQHAQLASNGQRQVAIPRGYDDWHTKYKDSARNDRQFGDCRPPSAPPSGAPLPKPTMVGLEVIQSVDVQNPTEHNRALWADRRYLKSRDCEKLFVMADKENRLLGQRFVDDSTGKKLLPYSGPAPIKSGRLFEQRAVRYCDDRYVWFVAGYEELGKTVIAKYSTAGDFIYNVGIANPLTAVNNNYRGMVLDSVFLEDGYFTFYWEHALPTPPNQSTIFPTRMTRFRFREPAQ
jgi:hypothetical protein